MAGHAADRWPRDRARPRLGQHARAGRRGRDGVGGVGAVLVALLVPRTVSLTALRIGAPAALAVAIWVSVRSGVDVAEIVALAWTAGTAAAVLFLPAIADAFVDGSSYGPERRMTLRVPGTLLLGPVELTWAVTVAAIVAGPLLLAAKAWALGAIAVAAGVVAVRFGVVAASAVAPMAGVRARGHRAARSRRARRGAAVPEADGALARPGASDSTATDVTGRALGLVLELQLNEPNKIKGVDTDRLLFSPARPGALLREARERGLPVTYALEAIGVGVRPLLPRVSGAQARDALFDGALHEAVVVLRDEAMHVPLEEHAHHGVERVVRLAELDACARRRDPRGDASPTPSTTAACRRPRSARTRSVAPRSRTPTNDRRRRTAGTSGRGTCTCARGPRPSRRPR